MKTDKLEAAISYAQKGWHVLPIHGIENGKCLCGSLECSSPGKHPATEKGLFDATTDKRLLEGFFWSYPTANLAIRTGQISNLVIIDVDPKNDGERSLDELEATYGKLPQTVSVLTGGGGFHLYFLAEKYKIPNSVGKLGLGLDMRGENGYVVAPPSLHRSGRRYEFEFSSYPENVPIAELPKWLADLIMGPTISNKTSSGKWDLRTDLVEGKRNSTAASVAGHLLAKSVDPNLAQQLLLAAVFHFGRPPLSEAEIKRTFNSIAGAELRKRQGGSYGTKQY